MPKVFGYTNQKITCFPATPRCASVTDCPAGTRSSDESCWNTLTFPKDISKIVFFVYFCELLHATVQVFKETNANLRARLEAASHNRCLHRRKSPRAGEKPIKENTMTSESMTFHFNRAKLTWPLAVLGCIGGWKTPFQPQNVRFWGPIYVLVGFWGPMYVLVARMAYLISWYIM